MTAVDICNLALSYLGDSATVSSIDPPEGSAQAQHCARFYPMAVNLLLESHQWNFTTRRAYLAKVQGCYFNDWRFVYALPSDTTDVISVLPKSYYPNNYFDAAIRNFYGDTWWRALDFEDGQRGDFQIETMPTGAGNKVRQVILSNACDAVIRYTVSTVQPGMFPALFTDALAWKLASMLAGPLLKGDAGAAESKRCLQMSVGIMAAAMGQDANQRHGNRQPIPAAIRARA